MKKYIEYDKQTITELMQSLSAIFDIVRLVDPITMTVKKLEEDGNWSEEPYRCYHVWKKSRRCDNCISVRCYLEEHRYSKFEFINKDVYHVVSQCVLIDGVKYVLELVNTVDDDVLLTAYGTNRFVNQITTYNHKIYTDELTGLSNRRAFDERFSVLAEQASRVNSSLTIIMMDVDDFKQINDTYGHQEGDRVLQFVAKVIQSNFSVNRGDIVARYGGDEFVIVIKDLSKKSLQERIEKIQKELKEKSDKVGISVGAYYSSKVQHGKEQEMLKKADEALYEVKKMFKNNYIIVS